MKITLTDVGKRFNREWIFRHFNFEFTNGNGYAIIGPNGSGKSTLLQVIAGAMGESEGKIEYTMNDERWPMAEGKAAINAGQRSTANYQLLAENIHQQISISAPSLELIEEMTLTEFLEFHHIFKPFISIINTEQIITEIDLEKSAHKQIRYYSSGMKQRVKLAQAIFTDTPVLLLDEPCTNLDEEGIELYHELIKNYSEDRIVIVSSNDIQEYQFCNERINILDYKK
ncbi:MAG TPA: ATP-binding cassette domain-containing protein [Puia sp.]|jgi:ABC-type multidrug transport system ATPase subunit|nr:ATP-binding cassette domain-containing protein [Puia sp.]